MSLLESTSASPAFPKHGVQQSSGREPDYLLRLLQKFPPPAFEHMIPLIVSSIRIYLQMPHPLLVLFCWLFFLRKKKGPANRFGLRGDHPPVHEGRGARLPERAEGHVLVLDLRQARRLLLRCQGSRGDHPALHRMGRRWQRVDLIRDEGTRVGAGGNTTTRFEVWFVNGRVRVYRMKSRIVFPRDGVRCTTKKPLKGDAAIVFLHLIVGGFLLLVPLAMRGCPQ